MFPLPQLLTWANDIPPVYRKELDELTCAGRRVATFHALHMHRIAQVSTWSSALHDMPAKLGGTTVGSSTARYVVRSLLDPLRDPRSCSIYTFDSASISYMLASPPRRRRSCENDVSPSTLAENGNRLSADLRSPDIVEIVTLPHWEGTLDCRAASCTLLPCAYRRP